MYHRNYNVTTVRRSSRLCAARPSTRARRLWPRSGAQRRSRPAACSPVPKRVPKPRRITPDPPLCEGAERAA